MHTLVGNDGVVSAVALTANGTTVVVHDPHICTHARTHTHEQTGAHLVFCVVVHAVHGEHGEHHALRNSSKNVGRNTHRHRHTDTDTQTHKHTQASG